MKKLGFEQSEKIAALKPEGFSRALFPRRSSTISTPICSSCFPIYIEDAEVTDDAAFKRIPAVEDGT